jgi:Streptomycin adenylyltransferase
VVIERLIETWRKDDRIVAAFLGGSRARGQADEHSDIDVSVIVADDAYAGFISRKDRFVRELGEPLFLEDFGNEDVAFVILADGTELELLFFRQSQLHTIRSGPHVVLLDERGILAGMEFPLPELDRETQVEELRNVLFWFWHDVGHFTTALGRGQLWWAAGQLEQLRHYCVTLARIEQGVAVEDEPYWKLDVEISTRSLDDLRATFVPIERDAMLRAGRSVVASFRDRAPLVARMHALEYPIELDRLISGHLDRVEADPR